MCSAVEWADGGRVATLIALLKARDIVCGGPRVHRCEGNGTLLVMNAFIGFLRYMDMLALT